MGAVRINPQPSRGFFDALVITPVQRSDRDQDGRDELTVDIQLSGSMRRGRHDRGGRVHVHGGGGLGRLNFFYDDGVCDKTTGIWTLTGGVLELEDTPWLEEAPQVFGLSLDEPAYGYTVFEDSITFELEDPQ